MYYTQSTVYQSGSYERNSSNTFLSSSPWAYVGFAKGELNFLGGWASCMREADCDSLHSQAFTRAVRGHASPKNVFKYATWCVLEHIFIHFLLEKIKNIYFLYKNNDKLYSCTC